MNPGEIDYSRIPEHCQEGIRAWIEHGRVPGQFLTAVIKNDLLGAVNRADHINATALRDYALFFYNESPHGCYGSTKNFETWRKDQGLKNEELPS